MSSTAYTQEVAETIIRQLKEGTAPWIRPWEPGQHFKPHNPATGKEYLGMNALWLMTQAVKKGYSDTRWMTLKQAGSIDARVNKGEKSTTIQYWKWSEEQTKKDENGKPVRDEAGELIKERVQLQQPSVFWAKVFNAEQINGLGKEPTQTSMTPWERHQQAEELLTQSGVVLEFKNGSRAFYSPSTDIITLPLREQFHSPDGFYATALHELGHATGHPSRLNRDMAHPFGSEGYAREELRAEIASLMLGEKLEIGHDPSQHTAYIGSWIRVLEQNPREIFRAAADSEKIVNFLMAPQLQQEKVQAQETTLQIPFPSLEIPMPEGEGLHFSGKAKTQKENLEEGISLPLAAFQSPVSLPDATRDKNGDFVYGLRDGGTFRVNVDGIHVDKLTNAAIIGAMALTLELYPGQAIIVDGNEEFKQRAVQLALKHDIPIQFADPRLDLLLKMEKVTPLEADPAPTFQEAERDSTTEVTLQTPTLQPEVESAMNTSNERVYLAVPYADKDEAKDLGARWDKAEKCWFAPPGTDLTFLEPWMPKAADHSRIVEGPEPREAFADALADSGLLISGLPEMNGQIHRVPVQGDKPGEKNGAYVGHLDGHPAGYIQNFKTGEQTNWKLNAQIKALSAVDRARLAADAAQKRQDRANALEHQHMETAKVVEGHWNGGTKATSHPYLQSKGVQAHGLKLDAVGTLVLPKDDPEGQRWSKDGNLLIPVRDIDGNFWGAQSIDGTGNKSFPKGSRKHGGHHVIGEPAASDKILFAEGYATSATLHELTGLPVVVAFDSGNLSVVAEAYREKYPEKALIIAGDNDHRKPMDKNVGLQKAQEAAKKVDGHTLLPTFEKGASGSDWNDLVKSKGKDVVGQMLQAGISLADVKHKATQTLANKAIEQAEQSKIRSEKQERGFSLSL